MEQADDSAAAGTRPARDPRAAAGVSRTGARPELSIGDVAAETGVGESTLRMWEARYSFPTPKRLPSGHRPALHLRTVALLFVFAAVMTTTQHNGADRPAKLWRRCGEPPVTLAVLDDAQTRQPGREVDLAANRRQDLVNLKP